MFQRLKDNLFIVLGITLPVLLIVVVLAIRGINSWAVPYPAYMLVYAVNYESDAFSVNYRAPDSTFVMRYTPKKDENYHEARDKLVLHLVQPGQDIPISRDQVQNSGWRVEYIDKMGGEHIKLVYRPQKYDQGQRSAKLDFLRNHEFHRKREAPDGYKFAKRDRHHRDAFTHIFAPRSYGDSRYIIAKQTRQIPLPGRLYKRVEFLAWLKPKE